MNRSFLSNHMLKIFLFLTLIFFTIYVMIFSSVIRTIEEDELIKKGFDPKSYVEKIWESKLKDLYKLIKKEKIKSPAIIVVN